MRDVTTALAVGRNGAVLQSTRALVTLAADTLRIESVRRAGMGAVVANAGSVEPRRHTHDLESRC